MKSNTKRINRIIIGIGFMIMTLMLIYALGMRNPKILHIKHEYLGYTYYSSIFNLAFDENEAIYAFDSILALEPDYKFLLDSFYKDGYTIFFDDKLTYAWCTGDPIHSNDFSACVAFDKMTGDVRAGMHVNYINDHFNEKIFFHELSHYADHKMGDISQSDEFARIYNEEYGSSTLKDKAYYLDKREYFAEEAAYFIIYDSYDPKLLNTYGKYEDAPKTFDYIKENLQKLKESA